MHGGHLVLLGATGGGVTCRDPADCHLSVTFALWTLHPHKLHVVVLVEAKRHPLGHLGCDTHLQHGHMNQLLESAACGTQRFVLCFSPSFWSFLSAPHPVVVNLLERLIADRALEDDALEGFALVACHQLHTNHLTLADCHITEHLDKQSQ